MMKQATDQSMPTCPSPLTTPQGAGDIAIRVSNLSKCYQLYDNPRDRLKQFVMPKLCRAIPALRKFFPGPSLRSPHSALPTSKSDPTFYKEFWALKDVSFEIKKGETVGIIGRNGSGKSTLLQLICGTLSPTSGSVETYGRIAALLELGSGFNPEFTGRENVYMNAAVLGLSKEEIDARFDDIASFADIGDFIEQPVKTYSSGMFVRLAFAIQANVDPEILIVDEALAVGDAYFVHRCMLRFNELQKSGTTILFVSHDASSVRSLCSRAMWLVDGGIKEEGDSSRVVDTYLAHLFGQREVPAGSISVGRETPKNVHFETSIPNIDRRFGDEKCEILGAGLYDLEGNVISIISNNSSVVIRVTAMNKKLDEDQNLVFGYSLRNRNGEDIASSNSDMEHTKILSPKRDQLITVEIEIKLPLLYPGSYAFTIGVAYEDIDQTIKIADRIINAIVFGVTSSLPMHTPFRFDTLFREVSR
ncbi:ABC transporter ATP-binding protein [Candidatus Nitrotoga sp. 1052]|uniref:ABC transporter ATP-binding protein n=1 Tax=Candidatus Nitrotoga sp. 1052 TaxID=2886964 RepID=UPI001EF427C0|nr:ABC transporter ATP-binding protein [Candidatus Nitrotoga sp. 1052]CAH1077468.1 ABC transporter domain-containing protein [Candidatus Nitrotoga sp. 1052]